MAEEKQEQQSVNEEKELHAEEVFDEAKAEENTDAAENNGEVEELKAKLDEMENRYLRLRADFDNFRRRTQAEREANEKYRSQSLINDLLPLVDNFERALKIEATNEQAQSILQGMEMVYKGIISALEKEGVEEIEAVGKEFDPHIHQAVMTAEDENYGSNIVVEEFQKGYKLKDRVIRPSMVKVNQ